MTSEDYAEVYLAILCNIRERYTLTGNEMIREFKSIQNSVKRIKGVKRAYLVLKKDVADITAFANWKESEIKTRVEEILGIQGITSLEWKILVPA